MHGTQQKIGWMAIPLISSADTASNFFTIQFFSSTFNKYMMLIIHSIMESITGCGEDVYRSLNERPSDWRLETSKLNVRNHQIVHQQRVSIFESRNVYINQSFSHGNLLRQIWCWIVINHNNHVCNKVRG